MRRKPQKITIAMLLVAIVAGYAFTTMSLQAFIPDLLIKAWMVLILALLVPVFIYNGLHITLNITNVTAVLMLLIILLWNNQDIATWGPLGSYNQVVPLFMLLIVQKDSSWHDMLLNLMILFGLFYALATFLCVIQPNLYYSYILPIMNSRYTIADKAAQSEMAGFTAHYSTNGMYLLNGSCAAFIKGFLSGGRGTKRSNKFYITITLIMLIAFLMSGKRGTILCFVLSVYALYYVYRGNRPRGRLFKIITVTAVAVLLLYIASFVIPAILNPVNRMIEMIDRGDISTGRFTNWEIAWQRFLESPLIGHGWRWFYHNETSISANYDVHNCYLQFLVETGIVGSIPFFIFLFYNFSITTRLLSLWRKQKIILSPHDGGLIAFSFLYQTFYLIFIFEGTAFFNPEVSFPYMMTCAIVQYVYYRTPNAKRRKRHTLHVNA